MTAPTLSESPAPTGRAGDPSSSAPRTALTTIVLGTLLAVASAPGWIARPAAGLDASWEAAVHMAARNGLDFGSEIQFTYGPLGFLAVPRLYYSSTGIASAVFTFLLQLTICMALLARARRFLGFALALPLVYLAARVVRAVDLPQSMAPLVLLFCLYVLDRRPEHRSSWFAPTAGALCALMLLIKFNTGLFAFAACAATAWFTGSRGWRALGLFLGPFFSALVVLWLLTGNPLGNLTSWLTGSLQIAEGYSTAMGLDTGRGGDFPLLIAAFAIVGLVMWKATQGWETSRRLAGAAIVGFFLFTAFKHGFVRHDRHSLSFFGALPVIVLALGLRRRYQLAAFALVALIFMLASQWSARELLDPMPSLRNSRSVASDVVSPARRRAAILEARALQRQVYSLDAGTLAALAHGGVHVDPWEASLLWAYPELQWRPLPVFQSYTAYTADLDQRNARALVASDGPDHILRETLRSVDYRYPDFESPAATLAMICNYEQRSATAQWQVLSRAPNRCGAPERIGSVSVRLGQSVAVPVASGPPSLVVARLHGMEGSSVARVISTLYKSPVSRIVLADGRRFRLVPGTAEGPLLMAPPPELGLSPPFGFNTRIESFRIVQSPTLPLGGVGHVRVEFFRIPLKTTTGSRP